MSEQTADRWVSIQQAQGIVGVSRRTIYNWVSADKVTVRRTAGGSVRILESSLWRDHAKRVQAGADYAN